MLSVHTSPLDSPGEGDAGGMNVYIVELARRLADIGVEVDVFTRATAVDLPSLVQIAPGVTVRHIAAGPYEMLPKADLPAQLCAFTSGVLRAEVAHEPGWYDVVHSHYWLAGHVGWLTSQRWGVPLVHSMHTMSKVKNLALADGDVAEPRSRELGEEQVVAAAQMLVAHTEDEAKELIGLYGAEAQQVAVVPPGVDVDLFAPGSQADARARLGLPADAVVLLFAGRIQPLKAPDVLLRAAATMLDRDPRLREKLVVAIVGGPSGTGMAEPHSLVRLASSLAIEDVVRFEPPVDQAVLVDWYRAADLTAVPSYSESFGLVALESQACGTPVVAARVGGLRTAVADGRSGLLVDGHDPAEWAHVIASVLDQPLRLQRLRHGAVAHAAQFGWEATARGTLQAYQGAADRHHQDVRVGVGRIGL